jgi:SnoaL-like protein
MSVADKQACAEVIQAWGLARDQGRWSDLAATFTPDGEIAVSWFRGRFAEFVERCRASFASGVRSKHLVWPALVRVQGARAVAETNIAILVRQSIEGILVDLTSYGRFLDRLERRGAGWLIAERTAVYEQDRLDPVQPSDAFTSMMSVADVTRFPAAYRYMAFRVLAAGRTLAEPVHHDGTPETEALYARYRAWLAATVA